MGHRYEKQVIHQVTLQTLFGFRPHLSLLVQAIVRAWLRILELSLNDTSVLSSATGGAWIDGLAGP